MALWQKTTGKQNTTGMLVQKKRKRGFRFFCVMLSVLFGLLALPVSAAEEAEPAVSAQHAVLMEAQTGKVLYAKDANTPCAMASTTKVMTALLTVEAMTERDNPEVTITEEMVRVEGSSMGLRAGDVLTLEGIATGMLLASGNDAANAAAVYLAQDEVSFSEQMNLRAKALGMVDTNFVTPSGLDDDLHYSTAYDMALLARAAIDNPEFLAICSAEKKTVDFVEPEKTVWYSNHNRMLETYEGCVGVKTGFTKKAGRCLISAAERDGVQLIVVTLNAPDDWQDHTALLDYGFSKTQRIRIKTEMDVFLSPLVGGEEECLQVQAAQAQAELSVWSADVARIGKRVELASFLYAPVTKGSTVGRLVYEIDGELLWEIPLVAAEDGTAKQKKEGFFQKWMRR